MDDFLPLLLTTDTRKRITIGGDILKFLAEPDNSIQCDDIGHFIDGVVPWMQNSNFKVSYHTLDLPFYIINKCRTLISV